MSIKKLTAVGCVLSFFQMGQVYAADHIGFNVHKKGLGKVLAATVDYYLTKNATSKFVIPANQISRSMSEEAFYSNPVLDTMNSFVSISQGGAFNYTIKWEDISVSSVFLKDETAVYHEAHGKKFNTALGLKFSQIELSSPKIELCEFYDENEKRCDETRGFYGRFEDVKIGLKEGSDFFALLTTSVDMSENGMKLQFGKVTTNLEHDTEIQKNMDFSTEDKEPASLDFNFSNFYMPPPVLEVNGRRIELDVSAIKDVILSQKSYIASSLTKLFGNFVAQDFVGIVNNVLITELRDFRSRISLVNYNREEHVNQRVNELLETSPGDAYQYIRDYAGKPGQDATFFEKFKYIFRMQVSQVSSYCEISKIDTPSSQDLSAFFYTNLNLNNLPLVLSPNILNGREKLGAIEFDKKDLKSDISIAVSESYLNGLLKLATRSRLLKAAFNEFVQMKGVYIDGLNVHFIPSELTAPQNLKVVANMRINLSQLEVEDFWSFEGIWSWINNGVGSLIEGGEVWFPLELDFIIMPNELEEENTIALKGYNILEGENFKNTLKYPKKNMSRSVEKGIHEKLVEVLGESLNKEYEINLTDFLKMIPGLELSATHLRFTKSGHAVIGINIEDLDLSDMHRSLLRKEEAPL